MNVVISQAMATGLPVITTRHSGLPDQVQNDENGFLVAEGDYQGLSDKILEMIRSPEKWSLFGQRGREIVLEKYNSDTLIEKQIEIYKSIIKKS